MGITVNGKLIGFFNFSGGECHVSIAESLPLQNRVEIRALLYGSDDIMRLLMTVDAIRRENPQAQIDLIIPYFPYARQDRVCNKGEAFSASVMAELINNLNCASVTIFDLHSDITAGMLKNCKVVTQAEIISESTIANAIRSNNLTLVAPDAGAAKKAKQVADKLNTFSHAIEVAYCTKVRDQATREITETHIPEGIEGKNLLILDDICDGGRTFIQLAQKLKQAGAGDLYLYVTHGIFSYGLDALKKDFRHVYCYHTFLDSKDADKEFLTVLEEM